MVVPEVDEKLLGELEGNASLENAVKWVVEHENDPDIDEMPAVPISTNKAEASKPKLTPEVMKTKEQQLREPARKEKEEEKQRNRKREKERLQIDEELLEAKKAEEENERKPFALPFETTTEILLKLPAKSLLRFRCVSKPWKSLICCQSFMKNHLTMASQREDYGIIYNVMCDDKPNPDRPFQRHNDIYALSSLLYGSETLTPGIIDIGDVEYPSESFDLVGSCRGLVCIRSKVKGELFLWNPCTKEPKKLPSMDVEDVLLRVKYGFGYDDSIDDYKVVAVFSVPQNVNLVFKVYSLLSDCWGEMAKFEVGTPFYAGDLYEFHYARGKLYWRIYDIFDKIWIISGLQLADGTIAKILGPKHKVCNSTEEHGSTEPHLGALGDSLSVMYHDESNSEVDVWVLKEGGDEVSWTKLFSISILGEHLYTGTWIPVYLSPRGELFFVLAGRMVLYNPKTKILKRYRRHLVSDVMIYAESLVSPNAARIEESGVN